VNTRLIAIGIAFLVLGLCKVAQVPASGFPHNERVPQVPSFWAPGMRMLATTLIIGGSLSDSREKTQFSSTIRTTAGAGIMTQTFNPPHPGKVLREYLGDIDVTTAARRLHVSRTTLSRILNGASGISADMSMSS